MSLELSEKELLDLASRDVDGVDLTVYVSKKYPNWHPVKVIRFLDELFHDKDYNKLVASMLTVKFQRIRSNLLKQVDTLMKDGNEDILKSVDKLLNLVVKFSKLDDDETSENRLIIRMSNGTEENFRKVQE